MKDYKIYENMGDERVYSNVNQAYLCYENAEYLCEDENICKLIRGKRLSLRENADLHVKKTSIVIVSYNSMYLMQKCIESIRTYCVPDTYEVVVVDNASTDGIREWLCEQEDVKTVLVDENVGFPMGCNIGVQYAESDYDIFLLNNDTRLAHNSLFWLRMGLYEKENIGATGAYSNYAGNEQQIDVEFELPGEYLKFGAEHNIPISNPYEERVRLSGFAMLIRRGAWNASGGMDEDFSPGYFEDDDLSVRILQLGYRLMLCRNSFIYHAGSQSFALNDNVNNILLEHQQFFVDKHHFDILQCAYPDRDLIGQIPFSEDAEFNILQVGSGLGADLKYIRSRFPKAHAVGIEKNSVMYDVSVNTDMVVNSVSELLNIFRKRVFHVLLIKKENYRNLCRDEIDGMMSVCRNDCILLPKVEQYVDFPYDKIKMVIWDMDDTFWNGTLSEGDITASGRNMELIKDLTDCGIINSISSKNNESDVLVVLDKLGMREYFVFPDINWDNKGEQIKKKLTTMGLRPENVLFIDDNSRNLEEAAYFNKGLLTAGPDIIEALFHYISGQKKSDKAHKRLERYHLLEQKCFAKKSFASDEQFLYYSGIEITIRDDCAYEIERIAELVARTNQLNYTKLRSTKEELEEMIADEENLCGYVKAKDRFGDYGIIGFYCYSQPLKKVYHFLFSCRAMGMGIEQTVYALLGTPDFAVTEPVAVELDKNMETPWIKVNLEIGNHNGSSENISSGNKEKQVRILLKGPCDLSAIEGYLRGANLVKEFNYVNDQGFITTGQNHSMNIWESTHCSEQEIEDILREVPFITKGDFETSLFKDEYHVICYSLLPDCHSGLYRNKQTGAYISFGSRNFDLTLPDNMKGYIDGTIVNHAFPFTSRIISDFAQKWEFVGATSGVDLIRNLDYMITRAPGNPAFVLLLGSEIEYEGANEEFANHAEYHREINRLVRDYAKGNDRIRLVEMTNFIHSQADYKDCINHFSRSVYYNMATEICTCINELILSRK